ncbi:TPA: MetQ/NlpA family ABC transporter substrate-binding protein [Proteus mirabilis]|nr:MetQ/NlpA family ABC transporter substrate-binding protein [Proteus mirabilis]
MRKLLLVVLLACTSLVLTACSPDEGDKPLKVAINTGPDQQIWDEVVKLAKEKQGLDIKVITFNDYVLPNEALRNNDVDVNAFQTVPYYEAQSKERGYQFEIIGKTFIFPIAAYSNKIKNIEALPDGATVAISNEATTLGRSLLLLQAQGLIKLKDGVGYLPTTLDIIENPKKPNIYLSIINNNFSSQVGLLAKRDGLFMENTDSPYVNLIVARATDKDNERLKKLVAVFQSDEILQKAQEVYKGDAVKAW